MLKRTSIPCWRSEGRRKNDISDRQRNSNKFPSSNSYAGAWNTKLLRAKFILHCVKR